MWAVNQWRNEWRSVSQLVSCPGCDELPGNAGANPEQVEWGDLMVEWPSKLAGLKGGCAIPLTLKSHPLKLLRTDKDYFLLNIPSVPHYRRTERSFSFCGPNVWNKLPYNLRTCNEISIFKKLLKHHLFSKAFSEYWLIWLYYMN